MIDIKETTVLARNSGARQENSIENQIILAEEAAKIYNRLIVDRYIDKDCSAYTTEIRQRKELLRLINNIKCGKVKSIIVMSRDRFARNVQQWDEIYQLLIKYNVEIIFSTPQPPIDRDPIYGRTRERELMAQSQQESNNIGIRTTGGKIVKFLNGSFVNEKVPVGYSLTDKKRNLIEPNNDLDAVKYILRLFDIGENLFNISKKVKSLTGNKKWNETFIEGIISDKSYCGYRILKIKHKTTERLEPNIEPLITLETYERNLSKLAKMKESLKPKLSNSVLNNVVIRCTKCRKEFIKEVKSGQSFLKCHCDRLPIREEELLNHLCLAISKALRDSEEYRSKVMGVGLKGELKKNYSNMKDLNRQIDVTENKINKLFAKIEKGLKGKAFQETIIEISELRKKQDILNLELDKISRNFKMEQLKVDKIQPLLNKLFESKTEILELNNEDKLQLCNELIAKVTISGDNISLQLKS